jgi:hypothetical protein
MSNLFGYHSGQYVNNYSQEENKQFTVVFDEITQGFKVAMEQGLDASNESVQALVRRHYEFCLQFWKPNKESYKSLAMSYIIPSPYQETYEAVAKGLGKYHYDAIVYFADKNLE